MSDFKKLAAVFARASED